MKDHEGDIRTFVLLSEAWYKSVREADLVDEVMFGLDSPGGGTSGEMSVRWKELGGNNVPKLEVFDDGWSALATFPDVIEEMGKMDNENITPKQFCSLLLSCGFHDKTPRENPYKAGEKKEKHLSREEMLEKALASMVDFFGDDDPTFSDDARNAYKNAKKLLPAKV